MCLCPSARVAPATSAETAPPILGSAPVPPQTKYQPQKLAVKAAKKEIHAAAGADGAGGAAKKEGGSFDIDLKDAEMGKVGWLCVVRSVVRICSWGFCCPAPSGVHRLGVIQLAGLARAVGACNASFKPQPCCHTQSAPAPRCAPASLRSRPGTSTSATPRRRCSTARTHWNPENPHNTHHHHNTLQQVTEAPSRRI